MNDVEDLLNLIRREVERSIARIARPRGGVVTQYDPARHAVQVQWPEDVADDGQVQQSPWMPIRVNSLGNGWGLAHGPAIGSQAVVDFLDGNPGTPFVSGFLPSLAEVPPAAPTGETWLVHSTGSAVKLTTDGSVTIAGHTDVRVTATGTLSATAAVINLN
jgi:uncharacterized protein involved in type VI secretion and phage assembly